MPSYYGPSNGSGQLRLDVSWVQNVAGNYSDVGASLWYVGQWASSANSRVALAISGNMIQDWTATLNLPTGTTQLTSGQLRHNHRADGTMEAQASGALQMPFIGFDLGVASGVFSLPTIPRGPSVPATPWRTGAETNKLSIRTSYSGSVPVTDIQIQRATNSSFTENVFTATSSWYDFTGLTPGTTYYFRARARNAQGNSAWSGTLTAYTLPQANTPAMDSVTATGMRAVFGRTGGAQGGVSWDLQRATNAAFTAGVVTISSNGTSVISGLTPGTTYYFRARGKNASGTGPWSTAGSATTLGVPAPGLSVTSGDAGTTVNATITAPEGVTVTQYRVEAEYLGPLPKPVDADKVFNTTSLVNVFTGLIPGAQYRWRVRAAVGSYVTDFSAWQNLTQQDPNALGGGYFDATITPPAPLTRVAGVFPPGSFNVVQLEMGPHPKYTSNDGNPYGVTLHHLNENLVPSEGSTKALRVKLIRNATLARSGVAVFATGALPDLGMPVLASATYTAMMHLRTSLPIAGAMIVRWIDSSGGFQDVDAGLFNLAPADGVTPFSLITKSPEWAVRAQIRLRITSGAVDTLVDVDGILLALGRLDYFDGGTPDTFRFVHEWEGTVGDSISLRTTLPNATPPDPFLDPNCPPIPAPPQPPVPVNECIPEVDTWRRYWSPLSSDDVPEHFEALPIFSVTTGATSDGPIRILVFENPDNLSVEEFVPDAPVSEQVITFMPAESEAVLDAVSERSYGKLIVEETYRDIDHLVLGAGGGPASWPVLSCGMSYMIAIDVPAASPLGNINLEASLTIRIG